MRGREAAFDVELRRGRSEPYAPDHDGSVVAEDDIAGKSRRSRKNRSGHFRQQTRNFSREVEAEPASGALATDRGVAGRPDSRSGVESELGVESVERSIAADI